MVAEKIVEFLDEIPGINRKILGATEEVLRDFEKILGVYSRFKVKYLKGCSGA